jgi:YD repeat-containing protein
LGITIDELGRLRWTPTASQVGNHPVTMTITDESGGVSTQSFSINVQADTSAPTVKLTYAGLIPAEKGSAITFQVQATDDVKVADLQLLVDGEAVVLDPNGLATVVLNKLGNIQIIARAIDLAGNVGQDTTVSIPVYDPTAPANAPVVSFDLTGLSDNVIRSFEDIKGSVTDPDNNLLSYVVDVAPIGTEDWTTIFTGNREVNAGGVLGKFDPSIIADDSYRIRLTATDTSGLSSAIEDQVDVSSQGLKLGNFTLSFTDLSIPIAGIPINVTRTYDSLNARTKDDFGYGWRLEFRDTDLRTSLGKDEVYEELGYRTLAFKEGTKVFITLPGGKRETFTFQPKQVTRIDGLPLGPFASYFYTPEFVSEKGSTNKLSVQRAYITPGNGSNQFYGFQGSAYNPADDIFGNRYYLTTKEGIVYEIDASTGDLVTVANPNGNKLSFSDAGITSDSGVSIAFARDAQGKITSVTDPLGQVVKYAYDAKGDLVGVTDRENQTTQFIYSVADRPHYLNEIKDPLNKTLAKTEYDEQGRLKKVLNGANGFTEIAYDPANQLQTIKDALGNPTTYVYDIRGNVIQQVDALGHQTLLEYDDDNNLTKVTDPNDLVTKYTYDAQGNLISKTEVSASCGCGGVPGVTTYTYNSYGQNTSIVLPTGASLKLDYDDRGNMLSMKDGNGNVINSYTYDRRGNVLTETDTFGTTSYEYDLFGNVIRSTDALGKVTTSTYDANGKLKTLTDADGTSTFSYDKLGRQTKADYGNNIFVEYGYSGSGGDWTSLDAPTIGHIERKFTDDGKLAGWVTADGGQLKYEYDAAGRLYREIDPAGRITEYEYDAVGRVIGTYEVDRLTGQKTKYSGTTYDAGGRVMTQTDVFGNTTTNTYGFDGKLATTTNSKNQTYTYSYSGTTVTVTDPLGRKTTSVSSDYYVPTETIFSNGKKTSAEFLFDNNLQEAKDYPTRIVDIGGNDRKYTYDSFGRITSATDLGDGVYGYSYSDDGLSQITSPTGETLRYEYDDLGNLKRTINGDGSAVTNSYNASDNRLAKTTLASGDEIAFTYDSAGRVIAQSATKGGTTGYSYNADGAITSLQNASGTTSYTYDDKGRVSTMTDVNGSSISYRYDLAGRVLQTLEKAISTSTERITEYGYDVLGNLTSVKDTRGRITTMTYDAVNRLSEKTLPNGVKTVYSYDELDRVSKIETKNGSGVVLSSMTYERTGVGEPSKITREDGSYVTYSYDSALRLTKESYFNPAGALQNEITYGYDASGKRISKNNQVYAYNNAYQLQTVTGSNGSESYGYDADGRVSAINRDGQTLNLSHDSYDRLTQANDVTYLYDGSGNRIKAVSGTSERKFLQASNGGLAITELLTDADGNVISDYVYGNGSTPISKIDASGNSVYYLTDAMGSVIGEVDGDGNLITRIQYWTLDKIEAKKDRD